MAESKKKVRMLPTNEFYGNFLEKNCEIVKENPDLYLEANHIGKNIKDSPKQFYYEDNSIQHNINNFGGILHWILRHLGSKNYFPLFVYDCFGKVLNIKTKGRLLYMVNFALGNLTKCLSHKIGNEILSRKSYKQQIKLIEKMKPKIILTDRYKDFPCVPFFVPYCGILKKTLPKDISDLSKRRFCAFIVSNEKSIDRIHFFKKLSKYKKINSFGKVLNNMKINEDKNRMKYFNYNGVESINEMIFRKHKFVICFENSCHEEYITEKLPNVMMAGSIPIYKGAPNVGEYFNTDSFINFDDYGSYEKMIEKIVELDNDDKKYEEFLKQPWMTKENQENVRKKEKEFLEFLEDARDLVEKHK